MCHRNMEQLPFSCDISLLYVHLLFSELTGQAADDTCQQQGDERHTKLVAISSFSCHTNHRRHPQLKKISTETFRLLFHVKLFS